MASNSVDPNHFTHTDLEGDRIEVIEGELGAVFWTYPRDDDFYSPRDPVAVALRREYIPKLIETLSAILENE